MTNDEWITIREAAQRLAVSEKTIRRKIQKGELISKLEDSPYGKMYKVSGEGINTARQVIDIVKVNKEHEVQELAIALSFYMQERDKKYIDVLDNLKGEITALKQNNSELQENLQKQQETHLKAVSSQIEALKSELKNDKNKPFWKKLF